MSSSPRSTATISTTAAREHFAEVIRAIRAATPATTIEILTPDFLRKDGALEIVVAAKPDVFNHNLETVPSNYLTVRPGARYFHSIRLLQRVKELDPSIFTKSGIMVGPGRGAERSAAADGRPALGQCRLPDHRPVSAAVEEAPSGRSSFVTPDEFKSYETIGRYQGLPAGRVEPADALLAPCRRRLRQAARRARGATRADWRNLGLMPKFETTRLVGHAPRQMFDLVADVEKYPEFLPLCEALTVRSRKERDGETFSSPT